MEISADILKDLEKLQEMVFSLKKTMESNQWNDIETIAHWQSGVAVTVNRIGALIEEQRGELHPIYRARKRYNLSLRELSSATGISRTTIDSWERGKHIPTRSCARNLATALGFESGEQVRLLCREWREKRK